MTGHARGMAGQRPHRLLGVVGVSSRTSLSLLLMLAALLPPACQDEVDLYNTDVLDSYRWKTFSKYGTRGWNRELREEGQDSYYAYSTCDQGLAPVENWARLPYIARKDANQVFIEMRFSVAPCNSTQCRRQLELYLYESDEDTGAPWRQEMLQFIGVVSAGKTDSEFVHTQVRHVVVRRPGFSILLLDRGACLTIHRVLLFYLQCPEVMANMAIFPARASGATLSSETLVLGHCVEHAAPWKLRPSALCLSDGQLVYFRGACSCLTGYQPDLQRPNRCVGCPAGYFKETQGDHACSPCPENSHSEQKGAAVCQCRTGFVRSAGEDPSSSCHNYKLPATGTSDHGSGSSELEGSNAGWTIPAKQYGTHPSGHYLTSQASPVKTTTPAVQYGEARTYPPRRSTRGPLVIHWRREKIPFRRSDEAAAVLHPTITSSGNEGWNFHTTFLIVPYFILFIVYEINWMT